MPICGKGMKWVSVEATVDSGACDHVTGEETLPHVEIKRGRQFGACYAVANSEEVTNVGEQHVQGKSEEGHDLELVFQISQVHKTLLAVRKITSAGNRVVFDEEEGDYIQNKSTGLKTKIHKKNGTYVVFVWVLEPIVHTGMFQALGEDSEDKSGFRVGA